MAYQNRFTNFFTSARISRPTMKALAAYTLAAEEAAAQPTGAPDTKALAKELRPLFEKFDGTLGTGAAAKATRQDETIGVGTSYDALRAWPAEAARRFIMPQYAEGSGPYAAFFPEGRTAFSQASRKKIGTRIAAFIAAADTYATQVGPETATEARRLLAAYNADELAQGKAKKTTQDGSAAIQADQLALAVVLFKHFGTFIAAFAAQPTQAAAYFNLALIPESKAKTKPGA
ncbi:hypothetical protein [Hymenobacter terricola]|uniref:hypothetical protein n=1 Tax=Hymenobacter terricola TaxID=2819236 RepID=UPI001B305CF2|nr:hypothetical protein [Hymenobacter terricola]